MLTIRLSRVSHPDQEDGQSIPAQTTRLNEYIKSQRLELKWEFEITESSTKENRKKFNTIIDIIRAAKETIALVVDTVDRLQRSFKESVILDDLRKQGKLEIHFFRENLIVKKDSNSADLLRWDMAVMFARSYVLQLSDNVKRSIEQKLRKGEWITKPPIGYITVFDNDDEDAKSDIVPDPKKAPQIVKLFELYATGNYSMKTLAQKMADGLFNKAGKPLATSMIEHILKNTFYYGIMTKDSKEYPHRYEPLISLNLFLKCKKVREDWDKKPFQYAAKPFIFRGLITCDFCGCTVSPEAKRGYTYYSCTNYRKLCKRLYVPEKELLKPLYDILKRLELPQDGIDYLVRELKASTEAEQHFHNTIMAELKAEYDKFENRVSRLQDDKYDGSITTPDYDKKLKEYKSRQADIIQQMQEHSDADETHHLTAAHVLDLAQRAVEIFQNSEVNEKRQLLNFILQNCKLKLKTPMFTLKPVFNGILKAHETKQWLCGSVQNHTFRGIVRDFGGLCQGVANAPRSGLTNQKI